MEQEKGFELPMLTFWQQKERIPHPVTSDLVSNEDSRHNFWGFCLRNDGHISTGMVMINTVSDENNFTIIKYRSEPGSWQNFVFDNIPPKEGNCTIIQIWYEPCLGGPMQKCDANLVPTGLQNIPIKISCQLCEEESREIVKNITICVEPSEEC